MNDLNLLPTPIKVRLHQRRRLTFWVKGAGALAAIGILVSLGAGVYLSDLDTPVRDELNTVQAMINKLEASEAAALQQITTVTHELVVAEDIAGQPNWSVLLSVLAAGLDEGAYLERIDTALVMDAGVTIAPPTKAASGPYRVTVSGISLVQADATKYALFLEQCGLFDSVRLVATRPRPDVDASAVGFEILCAIGHIPEKAS